MPRFKVEPYFTLRASGSSFKISHPGISTICNLDTSTLVSPPPNPPILSVICVTSNEKTVVALSLRRPNSVYLFVLFLDPLLKKSAN
jgi:hypothetical protein